MSSHHVVREDQEPALLLLTPHSISFERIQELLEWSPLVIVDYPSLEVVLSWGIKIDVLLTSTENDTAQIAIDQAPLQLINSSGETTALESACRFLLDRKQVNLNVLTNEATSLFTRAESLSKNINIVLFDGKVRWSLVENGSYSKWLPAASTLKIFENGTLNVLRVRETGIHKIERSSAFWIGEEF